MATSIFMAIRRTREDKKIGNIPNLPSEIKNNYRKDAKLGTVEKDYGVRSLTGLRKKISGSKK